MLIQLCILFLFLGLGEFIVWATHIPIPASIIGMILLFLSLSSGIVKLKWVEGCADIFVKNLGFFFIPAGIGVMNCFGLISEEWQPIILSVVFSSALIMACTGWVHHYMKKLFSQKTTKTSSI